MFRATLKSHHQLLGPPSSSCTNDDSRTQGRGGKFDRSLRCLGSEGGGLLLPLEAGAIVTEKVASLHQADTCMPKLNEGDQIVLINGRDISEHTHDQVVMFIKASRESHSRELALVIRRKGNRLLGAEPQGHHLRSSGLSTQLLCWFFCLFVFSGTAPTL